MRKTLAALMCVVALGASAGEKHVIGYGWEFLAASTDDVYRNRAKLSAAGFSGFLLMMDRDAGDGRLRRTGDFLAAPAWKDADFDRAVANLGACLKEPGFEASMALAYMIPAKRLKWTDDAAWATAANNFGVLARAAKRAGFTGVCIDQEDYSRQRQFFHGVGDPDYFKTCALARQRGREVFGALFRDFPDARLMAFWMFTQLREVVCSPDPAKMTAAKGDLWPSFLNGLLDVLPPTAKFIDGNESTGYRTKGGIAAWRSSAYESARLVLPMVAPENRAKYSSVVSVGFGQYVDAYTSKPDSIFYLPPLGGSRLHGFAVNLMDALTTADDCIWVYGEHGTLIDWDRKDDRNLSFPTWESQMPGFRRLMRVASGGVAGARRLVAEEKPANLVANGGCDSADGKAAADFTTWTRLKDPPADLFGWDGSVGAAKPGALRLCGDGCYTARVRNQTPGTVFYVRAKFKNAERPSLTVGWQRDGNWDWNLPEQRLAADFEELGGEWVTVDGVCTMPDGADALGVIVGGVGTPEKPVYIDDVEVYVLFK